MKKVWLNETTEFLNDIKRHRVNFLKLSEQMFFN